MAFDSGMQKMQFEGLVELINEHNSIVAKVNAVTGDRESLAESIRESDEFADLRNKIAELKEQLDVAVNQKVEAQLAQATDDADAESLVSEIKNKKGVITSGINYYKKLYGDDAAADFPKVERIKGQRGGGAGGKRIRGYNWIVTVSDGEETETTEYENAANAAKALGAVSTKELQEYFFAKAGVDQLKDAPDTVEFELTWQEEDATGETYDVTANVKAYRTGPSGPPNGGTPEASPESSTPDVPSEDELAEL